MALSHLAVTTLPATAQRMSFIRDAEIEDLLSLYAKPIFKAAGLSGSRIRMRIVNDKSFNAFVLDGRNVFVNTGALLEAETPNEVIGVIAHETGHITGGHLASLRAKIAKDQTRSLLMQILGLGAIIAGGMAKDKDDRQAAADIGKSIISGNDTITLRSILAYRQVQESAADQAGIAYLTASKQSGRGMLKTFERFAEQELFSDRMKDPYVRSHPMAQSRIAQLRELAERSPYFSAADAAELQLRHDLVRAKLVGYSEGLQRTYNRYPESDQSLPAQYARTIAAVENAGADESLPRIEALIAQKPDFPYFYELMGDVYLKSGKPKQAIAPYRKALKLLPNQNLIRISLAQSIIAAGDGGKIDEAIDMLRKALVDEDNPIGYRQLATAYSQKGEEAQAYLAVAQAYLLEGNLAEAKRFAKRAQPQLKTGSPGWLKADDIITFEPPS